MEASLVLRKILKAATGERLYSRLRSARKSTLGIKDKPLGQLNRIWISIRNALYIARCKFSYSPLQLEQENLTDLATSVSQKLDQIPFGKHPYLAGPQKDHLALSPLFMERDLDLANKAFWKFPLYQSDLIQNLVRGTLGHAVEQKLGARAFFYTLQIYRQRDLLKIAPPALALRPGVLQGFVVLKSTELKAGSVIFLSADLPEIQLRDRGPIDLLYFCAIPTTAPHRLCQQAGYDQIAPVLLSRPEVGTAVIEAKPLSSIENKIKSGKYHGLNLGGGDFQRPHWLNIDARYGLRDMPDLYPRWIKPGEPLLFPDASLQFVYTSHFFEHIDDATIDFCLSEANRTLKKGGLFFGVIPDFETALRLARKGDWGYIQAQWDASGEMGFNDWARHGIDLTLDSMTASLFCSYGTHPVGRTEPTNRIPPISSQELHDAIQKMEVKEFSQFLNSKIPSDIYGRVHHNAFTKDELEKRLRQAGLIPIDPYGPETRPLWEELGSEVLERWKSQSMYFAGKKP